MYTEHIKYILFVEYILTLIHVKIETHNMNVKPTYTEIRVFKCNLSEQMNAIVQLSMIRTVHMRTSINLCAIITHDTSQLTYICHDQV